MDPPSDNLNPKAHLAQIGRFHLILYPLADPLQLDCCLNEGWGAWLKSYDADLEIKALNHELRLHLTWSSASWKQQTGKSAGEALSYGLHFPLTCHRAPCTN